MHCVCMWATGYTENTGMLVVMLVRLNSLLFEWMKHKGGACCKKNMERRCYCSC